MLLSIVIINYNTFQLTCDCIRSIKETTALEHEIILVDNNSKEGPAEKFLNRFPDVNLICLEENVGFGRANNVGVERSAGKYILLLNSDTVVKPGTINQTVNYLEQNPSVDVLGCKVMYDNETVQTTVVKDEKEYSLLSAIKFLIKRNTFFVETRLFFQNRKHRKALSIDGSGHEQTSESQRQEANKAIEINYHNGKRIGSLVGVFLLLKRSVYVESKGFDPDFFMYYEEIEWFVNRLRKYNIVYYPHASILHFHGGSDVHKKMTLQFFVSQYLFWYKMGYVQYFLYLVYNLFEIPSRLMVRYLYNKSRPGEDIPALIKSLPYFFTVLRYSNKFGARKNMLKLNYLQKNNL